MRRAIAVLLLALPVVAGGQKISGISSLGVQFGGGVPITHALLASCAMTSNANCTIAGVGVTPARKQLGNFGTGCSGGTITPTGSGIYVGQLYATAAIQTSAEAAGCAVQGIPTATSSGTGIATPNNGMGAGGTDSATAFTDTYGASTYDSFCTSDTHNSDPSYIAGINLPGCATNGSSVFSQTVSASFTNVSMLFPTLWGSNSTTLDLATGYMDSFYWSIPSGSAPRNLETDTNLNSSPTAYTAGQGAYYGWGVHYSFPNTMYEVCPQNCSSWTTVKFHPVGGGSPLTTYPITLGHVYHTVIYGHRGVGAGYNSFCYDAMTVYDVTALGTPTTYTLTDGSGATLCYAPVNHSTWTAGPDTQAQLDSSSAGTPVVHMASRITIFYQ
jgi:hypothetical protein